MNRHQLKRIEQILDNWILYKENKADEDAIIYSTPGDLKASSDYLPNPMAGKAERSRGIYFSKDQIRAHTIISALPDEPRKILTTHRELKGRNCSLTNSKWTHENIALYKLNMPFDRYCALREEICLLVLKIHDGDESEDADISENDISEEENKPLELHLLK